MHEEEDDLLLLLGFNDADPVHVAFRDMHRNTFVRAGHLEADFLLKCRRERLHRAVVLFVDDKMRLGRDGNGVVLLAAGDLLERERDLLVQPVKEAAHQLIGRGPAALDHGAGMPAL